MKKEANIVRQLKVKQNNRRKIVRSDAALMKIHVEYKLQRTMCPSICLSFANENRTDEKNIVCTNYRRSGWPTGKLRGIKSNARATSNGFVVIAPVGRDINGMCLFVWPEQIEWTNLIVIHERGKECKTHWDDFNLKNNNGYAADRCEWVFVFIADVMPSPSPPLPLPPCLAANPTSQSPSF